MTSEVMWEASMGTFDAMVRLCGLTDYETAKLLSVRLKSVKRWRSGMRSAPSDAIEGLVKLYERQQRVADAIIEGWDAAGSPPVMKIELATMRAEAEASGWPAVAANMTAAAMAQAVLFPTKLDIVDRPDVEAADETVDADDVDVTDEGPVVPPHAIAAE